MLSIPILPYPRETSCVFSLSLTYESSIFVCATSSLPPIELHRERNTIFFFFSGGNNTSRARKPCNERKDNVRQERGGMSGKTGTTHG